MNSLSLYKLSAEHQLLLAQLYDPETGEVDQDADAKLNELIPSIEHKCVAVGNYIKRLEAEKAEIDYYRDEIMRREEAYERELFRLQKYLQYNMERMGIKEVKSPYFTLRLKKNPYSTEIFDESQIPPEYIRKVEVTKVETKINKIAIKEAVLNTGTQIPGALVAQKTKLEILVDKL